MFTGLVEGVGSLRARTPQPDGGLRLRVSAPYRDVAMGESIATNGVCLTVVQIHEDGFEVDVGPETRMRTTLGDLRVGSRLNLERSVTPTTRLGGHLVQGHVDAVGRLRSCISRDNAYDMTFDLDVDTLRMVIPRGSVAVDGISLTVTGRDDRGFSVNIIPHTWTSTNLSELKVGDGSNIEVDLIARYVQALLPQDA
ncbi:MAG: riboflavin synthase [Myxococcota bacterium]